ncbi:hypothetical protein LCGC14_1206340 [marine sediment metagenome]|uniref:ParB-like N-terminal domain-containing protein n=1 Tax=marine sediment metagenome TaxID=412755 RepID=A0A0F9PK41_9ZZZZ
MSIIQVDPEKLQDNPFQPRSHYPPKTIAEIAYSIEQIGIIHVPTGRQVNGHYEIAEGHLRTRAFRKLKKKNPKKFGDMPFDVRELSDQNMAIIALEENLRRHDITPLDQARAIDLYLNTFTEETETGMAKTMNMTQGNISNMRRVLKCPDKVLQRIVDGKINFTMARELLIFKDINLGKKQSRYSSENDTIRDESWLMIEAAKGVGGSYGPAATVDGIKKSIHTVCYDNMRRLDKEGGYYSGDNDPLFDTRTVGCLKCDRMIRANETKSQKKHYCTDTACWDEKQNAHKEEQAVKAKAKMEEDIAERLGEAVKNDYPVEEASPEAEETPISDAIEQEHIGETGEPMEEVEGLSPQNIGSPPAHFESVEEVCVGCTNQKTCDGTGRRGISTDGEGGFTCEDRVTKDNYQQVRDSAVAEMPDSFKEIAKGKAGTRAVVLDIRGLRMGQYSNELKAGHAILDCSVYVRDTTGYGGHEVKMLEAIEDPAECLERCTDGFHYAYDSSKMDGEIHFVCSKPKCLTKKKTAFTRAKNATGTAKKRAEQKAVKQAVSETTCIDRPRMLLIMKATITGSHVSRGFGSEWVDWIQKWLKVDDRDKILGAIDALPELELAQLLVEFSLKTLSYDGDIKGYKIQTTEILNEMGIGIQVDKPKKQKAEEHGTTIVEIKPKKSKKPKVKKEKK